jgi:hypothetical protein
MFKKRRRHFVRNGCFKLLKTRKPWLGRWRTLIAVLVARLKEAVAHGGRRLSLLLPWEAAFVSRTTTAWSADELDTLDQSTCEAGQRLSRYGSADDWFGGCCRERLRSRHGRRWLGLLLYLSISSGSISIDRFWRAIQYCFRLIDGAVAAVCSNGW